MKSPWIYGFAAGVAGMVAIAIAATAPPAPPVQAQSRSLPRLQTEDPIDLWMKLMPVFGHPRCTNCHGGVDPFNKYAGPPAVEHGGSVVGDPKTDPMTRIDQCSDCHNATEEIKQRWMLASLVKPNRNFFQKDPKTICEDQSEEVVHMRTHTPTSWPQHMREDPLITQSFDGLMGGARDPEEGDPPADPPPMKRKAFLEASDRWLDSGAVCGRWEGQVRQIEKFAANYSFPIPGVDGGNQVNESAKRDITFFRHDGNTGITVAMSGHSSIVQTMRHVAPSGPCETMARSTSDWSNLPTTGTDVSIAFLIREDGSYEIRVAGPKEKTRTTSSGEMQQNCGIPLPPPTQDEPIELTWDKWVYTIRCPSPGANCRRFDPSNPVLKGSIDQTILGASDSRERKSWLNVSPVGTSRGDDGSPLPVTVKTEWEFTLVH